MNQGFSIKSLGLLFVGLLIFYFAAFYGWEYWQRRDGPWLVTFAVDAAGQPTVSIDQPGLKLSGITLRFPGERAPASPLPQRVAFDRADQQGPFGRVIYEDLRQFPGVVTFDLFGHEIELVPRVLVVNRREVPWQSGLTLDLSPTNKPAQPPQPPKSRR